MLIDQYPESPLDLTTATHVISTTSDFPDYHNATEALIPVIRPQWIENSLAKDRLAHTRQFSPDPRLFMSDVVACCADLPEGDADAIAGGIVAMGGNFTSKITSLVTHVVALTMDNDMCETAVQRRLDVKIVLPHWFDDCLKLGRKIDEQPYQLPDPDILQIEHTRAPTSGTKSKQVAGATDPHPDQDKPVPHESRPVKIFKGKKFMLSDDLGIGSHLLGILHGMIIASSGKIVDDVEKANYYVCKYREGQDYIKASRARIDVGNLSWLYWLIMHDRWTSPFKRLLHYPVAKTGLAGFKGKKISLSNYSGEARTYLENLVKATGAECTKTLRQENTHLITAHDSSEKCAAARDWNIHMINHLWLEESYAKWQMQSETVPRYTHFPRRTNLGEVVGQTQIDRQVLERVFWSQEDVVMDDMHPSDGPVTALRATNNKQGVPTSSSPAPNTSRVGRPPKSKQLQDGNGNSGAEIDGLKTPASVKHAAVDKENITPATSRSRKSKEAAAAKLHQMTPDIALYEKEKKRAGGVVYGGRRKDEDKEAKTSRKRSVDAIDSDDADEVDSKKQRHGSAPVAMQLLVSGYTRWYHKPKQEDADFKRLQELGITVVLDPAKATHLAMPHVVRTAKAVVAIAYAPTIVSTDFIDACLEQNELLDPDNFKLMDDANEKKFGVSLELARERATENRHQLLQGRSIYVVDKIHGGFDTYQAIVEANGGQCMTYRGRRGTLIPSRRAGSEGSTDDDPQNEVYLLSSDSKEDKKLWPQFTKMAEGSRKVARIVKSDWLVDSAMVQKIQPTSTYELDVDG